MFQKKSKAIAMVLAVSMSLGALAGCGGQSGQNSTTPQSTTNAGGQGTTTAANQDSQTPAAPDPVTIKVLNSGDKPNDWDAVLEEFYSRTKDTLNITFDWTWVPGRSMIWCSTRRGCICAHWRRTGSMPICPPI